MSPTIESAIVQSAKLIVGRIVQALGVCATSVLSRAIARDLFEGEVLARALSLIMVAMAAAPGFSPLLGGAFNSLLGWRATFGVVGVLAIILMEGFGFSPLGLALFFASTVFVVFGAGMLAPRMAHRWGTTRAARTGIIVAFAGSVALLVGPYDVYYFSTALTVFLLGMGMINPLGNAITLQQRCQYTSPPRRSSSTMSM